MIINLRKRFILPIKWRLREYRKAKGVMVPSRLDLIDRQKELEQEWHKHRREGDQNALWKNEGKQELLNWLING